MLKNCTVFAAGLVGPKVGLSGEKRVLRAEGWGVKIEERQVRTLAVPRSYVTDQS